MSNLNSEINGFFCRPKRSKKRCLDDDIANESVYSVDGDEMDIYFLLQKCVFIEKVQSLSKMYLYLNRFQ